MTVILCLSIGGKEQNNVTENWPAGDSIAHSHETEKTIGEIVVAWTAEIVWPRKWLVFENVTMKRSNFMILIYTYY